MPLLGKQTKSFARPSSRDLSRRIFEAVGALEQLESLDPLIERARVPVRRVLAQPKLRDLLSGTPLGHPAHPMLVQLPIGCFSSALLLDVLPGHYRRPARLLIGAGLLSALPAAASGTSDASYTVGAEARVAAVHAGLNLVALGLMARSFAARRPAGHGGRVSALLGMTVLGASGWLGGHLAYAMGVGVDTNAFQSGPTDWTRADSEVPTRPGCTLAVVGGVGVAVVEKDGEIYAIADRCSHRGGPLSQGEVDGDCLVCPWHGSAFNLATGDVERGPASIQQPAYEARRTEAGLELRRQEPRAMRTNPVRPGSS
ncbi:MAG: Rieske (2Fe-2S) iron-sulfur domain protein [Acidimicrobiaceae bacterium]|nr:Rieske (2Fe-2S) iron-sulfur domain protein [Acidimicrobiaceae bacterium]